MLLGNRKDRKLDLTLGIRIKQLQTSDDLAAHGRDKDKALIDQLLDHGGNSARAKRSHSFRPS